MNTPGGRYARAPWRTEVTIHTRTSLHAVARQWSAFDDSTVEEVFRSLIPFWRYRQPSDSGVGTGPTGISSKLFALPATLESPGPAHRRGASGSVPIRTIRNAATALVRLLRWKSQRDIHRATASVRKTCRAD
jgi:hypothetical protein